MGKTWEAIYPKSYYHTHHFEDERAIAMDRMEASCELANIQSEVQTLGVLSPESGPLHFTTALLCCHCLGWGPVHIGCR